MNDMTQIEHAETLGLASPEALKAGVVLQGRYVLDVWLGAGGMGVVYSARDLARQGRSVAIKILNHAFASNLRYINALRELTHHLKSIPSPVLLDIESIETTSTGLVLMVMEYVPGRTLNQFMGTAGAPVLPLRRASNLIFKMAQGLAAAHAAGVVHGDLKPANILVTDTFDVKIIDFGLSAALHLPWGGEDETDVTRFDVSHLGAFTPAYASYAVLMGERAEAKDDLYALSCMAYELLSGAHPFGKLNAVKAKTRGLTVKEIPGVPASIGRLLGRHLAFVPQKSRSKAAVRPGAETQAFAMGFKKVLSGGLLVRFLKLFKRGMGLFGVVLCLGAAIWGTYRFVTSPLRLNTSLRALIGFGAEPAHRNAQNRILPLIPLNFGVNFTPETPEQTRALYISWASNAFQKEDIQQALRWTEEALQWFPADNELEMLKQRASLSLGQRHIEQAYLRSEVGLPALDWEEPSFFKRQQILSKRLTTYLGEKTLESPPQNSLPKLPQTSSLAQSSVHLPRVTQSPLKISKKEEELIQLDPCHGKTSCFDKIASEIRGPELAVFPDSAGVRVMTRYPVTIRDFNYYCRISHRCEEHHDDAIHVSSALQDVGSVVGNYNAFCRKSGQCEGIADAVEYQPILDLEESERANYLKWLHERTGHVYRLPTRAEWQYALEGGGAYPCVHLKGTERHTKEALTNSLGFSYFPGFSEWFKNGPGFNTLELVPELKSQGLHCMIHVGEKSKTKAQESGFHLVRE